MIVQQTIPFDFVEGCTKQILAQTNQVQMIYCPTANTNDVIVDEVINCVLPPLANNIGGLFIGNYKASTSSNILARHNIKAVLTAAKETPVQYQASLVPFYLQLDMSDNSQLNLESFFQASFDFIENGMKFGNVLVHCHMGISRSAAIILGYLIKQKQWTLEKALWVLRVKRPIVNPNSGFMEQLFAYELKLFGRNSLVAQEKKSSTLPLFLQEILKKSPAKIVRDHQIINREEQQEYVPLNKSYIFEELPPQDTPNTSQNLNTSYISTNNRNVKYISVTNSNNQSFNVNGNGTQQQNNSFLPQYQQQSFQ